MAVLSPCPPVIELQPNLIQLDLFGNHFLLAQERGRKKRKERTGQRNLSKDKRKGKGRKKGKGRRKPKPQLETSYQVELSVFPSPPTDTEYLLFSLWDGLKKRHEDSFIESNKALAHWLVDEQYELLLRECRKHFTIEDKVWLLSIFSGEYLKPMSLLYCHKWQYYGLMVGNYSCSYVLTLFLALWANNSMMSNYGTGT